MTIPGNHQCPLLRVVAYSEGKLDDFPQTQSSRKIAIRLSNLLKLSILAATSLVATTACATSHGTDHSGHSQVSKYAGQEGRAIKSLSADDIAELQCGGGWGLAKAAELNGVPGPAHLLEMKNEVPLTVEQVGSIEVIYADMKKQAVAKGEALIALETELEQHFIERTITDPILRELLGKIATPRSELRYIHLSTHLQTPKLLSEHQISRYNQLRGYSSSQDPCDNIPEGHDPDMYRKHNNCS